MQGATSAKTLHPMLHQTLHPRSTQPMYNYNFNLLVEKFNKPIIKMSQSWHNSITISFSYINKSFSYITISYSHIAKTYIYKT